MFRISTDDFGNREDRKQVVELKASIDMKSVSSGKQVGVIKRTPAQQARKSRVEPTTSGVGNSSLQHQTR
jgi:hypothetical protein